MRVLRSAVGPTVLHKNFETNKQTHLESLIADLIQFSGAIAKFLFLQRRSGTTMCALNFVILLKFPHFLSRLTTREVTRTFSL